MLSRIQRVRMTANTNKLFHRGFKSESVISDMQKKYDFRLCLPQSVMTETDFSGFYYSLHILSIKIFLDVEIKAFSVDCLHKSN